MAKERAPKVFYIVNGKTVDASGKVVKGLQAEGEPEPKAVPTTGQTTVQREMGRVLSGGDDFAGLNIPDTISGINEGRFDAQAVLDAEQAAENPRSSLITQLESRLKG